ncbi:MAG: DUF5916 domain-containing protein [Vicinamibacterales bacterium]
MRFVVRVAALCFALLVAQSSPASAQAPPRPADVAPPQLNAVRLTEPLQIDGKLDEPFYTTAQPFSNFVQVEPSPGQPPSERTEVWLAFDAQNVYVAFRNWESQPDRIVAKEMRRDTNTMWGGDDIIAFIFDTFHDGRNGFQFALNSIGGRDDGQVSNERQYNGDWNTVWNYKAGRFDRGWVVEVAIPFKSLRYGTGQEQVWGFNAFRTVRRKTELAYLTPTSTVRGQQGLQQTSLAATLNGISAPSGAKNLELKPYVISNTTAARAAGRGLANHWARDFGGDVKYGITQNLTADFTYNTDFAQVEADQQQVNLTRFSLFFPEKREFFLENQGTFQFGTTGGANAVSDVPTLFYSRRIGLEQGLAVPINVGGRLTGRAGPYTLGVIDIQTGEESAARALPTNFSVVRLKRDILRRSSIGLIMTGRYGTESGRTDNTAYGVDSTLAFFRNLTISSYWARTEARPTATSDRTSYRAQLDYNADRYGLQVEQLGVGRNFNPGIGFVRRPDISKSYALARFSPRPRASRFVRKYYFQGSASYIENGAGRLDTRNRGGEFDIDFTNGDKFILSYDNAYEYLPAPFRIATGVTLPVGGYSYDTVHLGFNRAARRRGTGNFFVDYGTFYNGHKTGFGVSGGRFSATPQLAFEPTYSANRADLVQGRFTTHLAGLRAIYTPAPRMFTSAFLQYNSSTHNVSANVRLRWEYQPGSELFVVFNEDRDTFARGFPEATNRAFIVKVNRLFRF